MKLTIEVFSDVICPWCYIGKCRLERARKLLGDRYDLQITWRPFQLNPDMPPEGIERKAYRTAKFSSWKRSLELDAQVAAVGEGLGITFRFDRIIRTPNRFAAHRLIWYSKGQSRQDTLVEALFRAYFLDGRDIGDRRALAGIAAETGLERAEVECLLESDRGSDEVRRELERRRRLGINAVPHFLINERLLLSGAQEPERIVAAIEQVAEARRELP